MRRLAAFAAIPALLLACADLSDIRQSQLFVAPPVEGVRVADLPAVPGDLAVAPDGAWRVADAVPPAEAAGTSPYRLAGETLLVPIAGLGYDARIERALAPGGTPQVAWSTEAGVLVAAARGGRIHPGTVLLVVGLRDGATRAAASWEMAEEDGYQGLEAMRLSPDGRFLACQIVESHPARGGFREAGRRGLVVPLAEAGGKVVDLGPEVRGPLAWSPDGRDLFFVRASRSAVLYRIRIPGAGRGEILPAPAAPAPAAAVAAPAAANPVAAGLPRASQEAVLDPIMQLSSGNPVERIAAADALALLPHPMAVGPLIRAMRGGDPGVCRAADGALRRILARPAVPPLAADAAGCARAADDWQGFWTAHPDAVVQ